MPASGIDESPPRRARIGGVEIAWSELDCLGPVEQGPPLVLVHGFTGHRDDFVGVIPELARSRRVIAPDLRGHGDSHSPSLASEYSFEHLGNDLLGLLDHLEIERCDLLGHSMGGMLSLRFALEHPERIRGLIFLCTGPEVPEALDREVFEKAAAIAAARGMEALQSMAENLGRANLSAIQAAWGERLWMHHRRRYTAMTPTSYRELGEALFESDSLVPRLHEIEHPTLVVVGEHDRDWLAGADLFESHLPRAKRVTLADSEHHPHQENPSAWLEAVESYLAGLPR